MPLLNPPPDRPDLEWNEEMEEVMTEAMKTAAEKVDDAIRELPKSDAIWVVMTALMNRGWFDAAYSLDEHRQPARASCQTDLSKSFPQHVACEWLGNSEKIADDHYLSVTDADFDAAIKTGDGMYAAKSISVPVSQTAQTTEGEESNGILDIVGQNASADSSCWERISGGKSTRKRTKRSDG